MEASVATPGQGTPAAGVQPGAPGQGAGQGQSTAAGKGDGGQFNWGLFPDVPMEQRELLEPHLKNVQGHVTQLEQRYAPYAGLMEHVQPNQVENLIGFLNGYANDSATTVLGLLQQGLQDGTITPDALQQIMPQQAPQPGQQAQPGQEDLPPWAQQLMQQQQEIMGRFGQFDEAMTAQQQQEAEAEQERILGEAKTNIRAQLTQAEIGEDQVSDELLVASIIACDGDEQAAANLINQTRQNFLAAFTNGKTAGGQPPAVNGDLPKPAATSGRKDPDGFGSAKTQARQFLEQQAQMAASG